MRTDYNPFRRRHGGGLIRRNGSANAPTPSLGGRNQMGATANTGVQGQAVGAPWISGSGGLDIDRIREAMAKGTLADLIDAVSPNADAVARQQQPGAPSVFKDLPTSSFTFLSAKTDDPSQSDTQGFVDNEIKGTFNDKSINEDGNGTLNKQEFTTYLSTRLGVNQDKLDPKLVDAAYRRAEGAEKGMTQRELAQALVAMDNTDGAAEGKVTDGNLETYAAAVTSPTEVGEDVTANEFYLLDSSSFDTQFKDSKVIANTPELSSNPEAELVYQDSLQRQAAIPELQLSASEMNEAYIRNGGHLPPAQQERFNRLIEQQNRALNNSPPGSTIP